MGNTAIYWDFENIHISLSTINLGKDWYKENRFHKQPTLVDIDAIMEYVVSLGNVNINKGYANWGIFFPYNYDLQTHAVDLIQLFPRGSHGKNGADIRMAIDIIEDINQNSHIDTVVVVGGDSDYISIAQKVRQKGKKIIGIGVRETTNQYWISSCNEFKFYSSLLTKSTTSQSTLNIDVDKLGLDDAKKLLCKAISALSSRNGDSHVKKAALKPMMTRLDSSFDEANYGYKSFSAFLEAFPDIVTVTTGQHDHMVSMAISGPLSCVSNEPQPEGQYHSILKKQNVRLVEADLMEAGARETFSIFTKTGVVESYEVYKNELLQRLTESKYIVTETDVSKIKALLYKTFAFCLDHEHNGIALSSNVSSADSLLLTLRRTITKRILDNIEDPPDLAQLSQMLYGDTSHSEEIKLLIHDCSSSEQSH